jgi:coiled-coil domain-containing protein 61
VSAGVVSLPRNVSSDCCVFRFFYCYYFIVIEELTLKSGNLKRFSLFVKMLSSAFSKSNDSVFVDLLTLSELEMIKARKGGSSSSASNKGISERDNSHHHSSSSLRLNNAMKRYCILTYTGEFDRVHYPLSLVFEEKPNVLSLQRTIRRLRRQLKEKEAEEVPPSTEKERYFLHLYRF